MAKFKVNYNYLSQEFAKPGNIIKDWKKLIKSTDFTLGYYVERFERRFAKFINIKHCLAVNNGTDALILSLKALGISKGDEVITVCNTFYATVGAIVACGAKPIYVDSDDRFQINVAKIEKAITKKTKAIIPVHWGGASPDIKKIIKISKKYNLHVVEDACMGIGGKISNKHLGTFGIINAFSMHPLKSLNVMGDGGMIVTNDNSLAKWLRKYRNHGMTSRNYIEFWGVNARMQPLQSIVAEHGLKKLNQVLIKRNNNSKIYDEKLSSLYPKVIIPKRIKGSKETFSLYMALFENRNSLYNYLIKNKIEVKIHYPLPLHLQKASKSLGYKKGDFPIAEKQAKKLITLPVHQFINRNQINYVVKKINEFYNK